jgi:hypothetical protein
MTHPPKRMSRPQRWALAERDLIDRMFEIAGHGVGWTDIEHRTDNWFQQWTMTVDEDRRWREWGTAYLRQHLRLDRRAAELHMSLFALRWGLKFSDWPTDLKNETA